jgi:3-deoxy-D-manno-octulosonic acid kinase
MLEAKTIDLDRQHILYDASRHSNTDTNWFDPDYWQSQQAVTGIATGRAKTLFFAYQDKEYVLRHYHRGGMVSRIIADQYVWTGLNSSRAWREWYLLVRLNQLNLPAPVPVAARVQRNGFYYRADLITERITGVESLANWLMRGPLVNEIWQQLGSLIARFHHAGVDHADLNAHNILLDEARFFLIDFDRGRIRRCSRLWQKRNLSRLLRSLNKLNGMKETFHFKQENWSALLQGYFGRI